MSHEARGCSLLHNLVWLLFVGIVAAAGCTRLEHREGFSWEVTRQEKAIGTQVTPRERASVECGHLLMPHRSPN